MLNDNVKHDEQSHSASCLLFVDKLFMNEEMCIIRMSGLSWKERVKEGEREIESEKERNRVREREERVELLKENSACFIGVSFSLDAPDTAPLK